MLSIFIMYSTDRAAALDYTIACLQDMDLYEQCQKTLVVDGKIDHVPPDFEAVQVPRLEDKFCWGRMWDAGVLTARHDRIVYLDSDRLLPRSFLTRVAEELQDDVFVFSSSHFMMLNEIPIEDCKRFLGAKSVEEMLSLAGTSGVLRYESRHGEPFHGPGKNVMSGSTAFTKRTYLRLGGVDYWYSGHGAFADTDFHYQSALAGCRFIDLDMPELHFPHSKLDEESIALDKHELWMLSLDNFIYYCWKWKLPLALAEGMAARSGVQRPATYVTRRLKSIKEAATGS